MNSINKRIVVAMSGGVDSSVVASIMHEQGHEVIGVTLQLYNHGLAIQKKNACCAGIDIYDAKMVASKLGIKHYVLDYESKFKEAVIDDFVNTYMIGQTPLPCVRCNQSVKFKDLMRLSKELGADMLVTGHYVRKIQNLSKPELHMGKDLQKDQSYFLFATTKEQLEYLDFPLGDLTKDETRILAKKYGLINANKPDSQDICFVPDGNYKDLIRKLRPDSVKHGKIMHEDGFEIGTHSGIINYTIGQRKGLGISFFEALYVTKIDPEENIIYVGQEHHLKSSQFFINEINWLGDDLEINQEIAVSVKIRSTKIPSSAKIVKISEDKIKVILFNPEKSITPGQACVIYNGERVLGGGFITKENF
jgi:tRNA-specific 2-thiouridylase